MKNEILFAEPKDLEKINELIDIHNIEDNRSYTPYHFYSEDLIKSDKNLIFISKRKGLLSGYAWLYSNQPFSSTNCVAKIIIVVSPSFQKSGIGDNFIKFLIEYAKKNTSINKLIAEIKNDNIASKNLFKKNEFVIEHENGLGCTMAIKLKR